MTDLRFQIEQSETRLRSNTSPWGQGIDPPQADALEWMCQTKLALDQNGQRLHQKLLTQALPRRGPLIRHEPPQPSAYPTAPMFQAPGQRSFAPSHGTPGTEKPPLFPVDAYQMSLPQQAGPEAAQQAQVPVSAWDSPRPPPMARHAMPVPSPATATGWRLASHIQKWMALNPHMPLRAMQVLRPLSLCRHRHDLDEALKPDLLQYMPDALAWLSAFDARQANELCMDVLLHYVERDEIVPNALADTVLSALKHLDRWPDDVKDVGLVLSKLKQQPDGRFHDATNALIYRLLPRSQ